MSLGHAVHPAAGEAPAEFEGMAKASDAEEGAGLRAWISIGILLLLTLSSNVDRNIIGMLVEPIKKDIGLDDFQFSLLHGFAFAIFFALASYPMGWAADNFSRRWILYLGTTFWSLCTAACGLAQNYAHLFVARLGVGIGEAALNPAAYSVVGNLFPFRRLTFALACLAMGAAIAAGVGAAFGGYIISWAQSTGGMWGFAPWQMVFWIVGLPGLVIAPLVFFIPDLRQPRFAQPVARKDVDEAFGPWLRENRRYFFCLSFGVGAHTALGTTSFWVPAFLARTQGLDIKQIGLLIAAITMIPNVVGYLGGGWLVDKLHARGVRDVQIRFLIVNTALLCVLGTISYGFLRNLPVLLCMLALTNTLLPCAGPAIAHLQRSAPVSSRARATALFLMIMHLTGTVIGPSSAALVSEYVYGGEQFIGLGMATTFAVGGAIGTLLFVLALKPSRRFDTAV